MSPYEFFLRELRRRREAAGLTQEELGRKINFSGSHVSAVELGNRPPKPDYLEALDLALDTGGLFMTMWKDLVEDAAPVWFRRWIEIEREATLLRWYEPSLVPGLLQTEAYARAVLSGSGLLTTEQEINQRLTSRLERQAILTREQPPKLVAVFDAAVLARAVAPAAVMTEQFDHLRSLARLPHVRLHAIPAEVGMHAGLAGAFILAKGPGGEAAHLDNPLRADVTDRAEDLDVLQDRWESVRSVALPNQATVDLIREVTESWT
jgi:transcriptional regulator with XRE-family HTH domain